MKPFIARPATPLKGKIYLLGDKSVAHRSVILASLSPGKTLIKNFPASKDCFQTINSFRKLGVKIKLRPASLIVSGKGLYGLNKPKGPIFIEESGTTFRLLAGVLAGRDFRVWLKAGKSLSRRPMLRLSAPLRKMGARISARRPAGAGNEEYPPLVIQGGNLRGITYKMPVASAQVKSAILLASLYAKGKTNIIEPVATRDHTERILKLFKAGIKVKGNTIVMKGGKELRSPGRIYIPADISSAVFFLVAASILPGSGVIIKNVCLNPSRIGALRALKRMGANIQVARHRPRDSGYEPMGDIAASSSSRLKGTIVSKNEIPSLIDELPVLMVASSLARGRTVFRGVGELRVKETDRIRSMAQNLKKMGAKVSVLSRAGQDEVVIRGVEQLKAAKVKSFGDHRTAMSMVVAGLNAKGATYIDDISCIDKSFPEFLDILGSLRDKSR